MKKMITALLLFSSFSAFSTPLELAIMESSLGNSPGPVKKQEAANIIKALEVELKYRSYGCTWNEIKRPTTKGINSQLKALINHPRTSFYVSDTSAQPIITTVTKVSKHKEIVTKFTTSRNFKWLVKVELSKENLNRKTYNVGTIDKPVYETIVNRKPVLNVKCFSE